MKRRFSTVGFAVLGASIGLAGAALAQSFPTNFAQRCMPDALRVAGAPQDPCGFQIAHFGLNGPTVIGGRMLDVETTGSLAPAEAGDGATEPRSEKE